MNLFALPAIFFTLLCPLIAIGVFIMIVIMFIRAMRSGRVVTIGNQARASLNVSTQLANDGFWMQCGVIDPTAIIHFHYWANGVQHSGQVPNQPGADGRQFVYTGLAPEQVVIVRIVQSVDDDIIPPVVMGPVIDIPAATWDPPASSPSSSSFPTAY